MQITGVYASAHTRHHVYQPKPVPGLPERRVAFSVRTGQGGVVPAFDECLDLLVGEQSALGVLGMLLFILASPVGLLLIGAFLWAVGVSLGFPLGMSAAAESGPNPAARVSMVASIGYLANLAGPPAIGLLSQSVGLRGALWAVAALLAVAFAVSGVFKPRGAAVAGDS
jgi:MFS family permease